MQRQFQPPKSGAAAPAAQTQAPAAATATSGAGKAAPRRPDFDLVACDSEFVEVEKIDKEIDGQARSVSRRIGAIWLSEPNPEYPKPGAPYVRLSEDGSDPRASLSAKLYKDEEQESDDGAMYTLRLVQKVGKKTMSVKGKAGLLARVWWATGRGPEFTFTEAFADVWPGEAAPGSAIGFPKRAQS